MADTNTYRDDNEKELLAQIAAGDTKAFALLFDQYQNKVFSHALTFVKSVEESKMLNYLNEPCVIISASGMAEAGRVKHHISNNIENSHNTILLTGYCEPNSLGGRLKLHPKEVNIFGAPHEVNAEIAEIRIFSVASVVRPLSFL